MGKKTEVKSEVNQKVTKPKKAAVESKSSDKVVRHAGSSTSQSKQNCKIASCKREYRAKGYCNAHYKKWRQGDFGLARYKTCGDFDCRKPMVVNRHGYCEDHYQNYYVKGMEVTKAAPVEKKPAEKKEAAG